MSVFVGRVVMWSRWLPVEQCDIEGQTTNNLANTLTQRESAARQRRFSGRI
ncbi:MAG: hypothetical protein LJE69_05445 [Thiohalocapsa sp.]|uniref:hypothetical protein n=1 Tax=Thiohalocapsa sp. TaxID=2497641 RepID=UPI0025D25A46|nr:hypothetical protein [Thiohalocapsa sp.]MCG6940677.1 hypothetical protein [Thiohalocapsa sp.]